MPVYAYRCQSCGVEFERTQMFLSKPLKHCPGCRSGSLRRVTQVPAIIFKGSGWYLTDHRSSSSQTSTFHEKNDKAKSSTREKSES